MRPTSVPYHCTCEDWLKYKDSINEINHAMQVASVYYVELKMRLWEYCPWCGKVLEDDPP